MKERLVLFIAAVVLIGWTAIGFAQQSKVPPEVWQKLQTDGVVRILVFMRLDVPMKPIVTLSEEELLARQEAVVAARDGLLAELARTIHKVTALYRNVPALGLEVGSDALAVLERSTRVAAVREHPILERGTERNAPKNMP